MARVASALANGCRRWRLGPGSALSPRNPRPTLAFGRPQAGSSAVKPRSSPKPDSRQARSQATNAAPGGGCAQPCRSKDQGPQRRRDSRACWSLGLKTKARLLRWQDPLRPPAGRAGTAGPVALPPGERRSHVARGERKPRWKAEVESSLWSGASRSPRRIENQRPAFGYTIRPIHLAGATVQQRTPRSRCAKHYVFGPLLRRAIPGAGRLAAAQADPSGAVVFRTSQRDSAFLQPVLPCSMSSQRLKTRQKPEGGQDKITESQTWEGALKQVRARPAIEADVSAGGESRSHRKTCAQRAVAPEAGARGESRSASSIQLGAPGLWWKVGRG